MDQLLGQGVVPPNYFTMIDFSKSYAPYDEWVLSDTLPKLGLLGGPDDVRVVYWFS